MKLRSKVSEADEDAGSKQEQQAVYIESESATDAALA